MAKNVDPDQMPHFVASDLGLHRLLKRVCPNILRVNMVLQFALLVHSGPLKLINILRYWNSFYIF